MATKLTANYATRITPQSQPIPGSAQVANSAGGFSFAVDDWARLERFLILGTEGGSYYAGERALTAANAEVVRRLLHLDGLRVVDRIVAVSRDGRAPKNDPAIFALAMALKLGDPATRALARAAVPKVCRIGTHLFQLAESIEAFGGWGRGTRNAFAQWYTREPEALAMQLVKYRDRHGWTHRDVLRVSHARPSTWRHDALFRWATSGDFGRTTVKRGEKVRHYHPIGAELLPALIGGYEKLKKIQNPHDAAALITKYGLPRECVPTELLNSKEVWNALLTSGEGMPLTAMIRNLGKMTAVGLLTPMSEAVRYVVRRLADREALRKARVHPIAILMAQSVYASGHGVKGSLSWMPDPQVIDALNGAFYSAFAMIEPTGLRWYLALDVSGSMDGGQIAGTPLTPREGAAALALVTAKTEANYYMAGFASGSGAFGDWHNSVMTPISITPSTRLDDAVRIMQRVPMGGTDCALPMLDALKRKIPVDVFAIYTDSETWAGNIHPTQALRQYREQMGIPAKLIVVSMVANEFSIADPDDAGMLDVVGFDAAAPAVMADFARASMPLTRAA